MICAVKHFDQVYHADLTRPIDLSIPLRAGLETVNCFYAPPLEAEPVRVGNFVGDTSRGGPVNFFNVRFNPHGNGTHTECVGHIALEKYTINQCLKNFHFVANLASIYPIRQENGDRLIAKEQLAQAFSGNVSQVVIIRTMPNDVFKLRTHYSGANPPYFHPDAMTWLVEKGVKHLLVDLPSVDREEDGGRLLSHRAFWQYPAKPRTDCTITELVFVNNSVKDGLYLLNLQIAAFELDASPSKPVIYRLSPFLKRDQI